MSLSKCKLSAALKRKCLSLDEKMDILNYAKDHPKMGCRQIAEHFSIGKTAVSNILKNSADLRKDFEFFKGNYKKRRHGKYHTINEILFKWYGKCTAANVYPDGSLLQEEAMEIKKRLNDQQLSDFKASNGWLESWKQSYGVREKRLCGEADDVSITTVKAWIERIPELCRDYEPQNILNLDELGLFFKALPEKGLIDKKKEK